MEKSTIKLTPIALVLCDAIYQEPGGKTALVGLFNSIATHVIPIKHPRMAVFASVTGVREGCHAKLEICHIETDQVVVCAQGPFPNKATALMVVDMTFVLNNVIFPEAGQYDVRFWGNDHLLMVRPFHVRLIGQKGADDAGN